MNKEKLTERFNSAPQSSIKIEKSVASVDDSLTPEILNLMEQEWGAERSLAFLDFCAQRRINDKHRWNWGYINSNQFVIMDYSGF